MLWIKPTNLCSIITCVHDENIYHHFSSPLKKKSVLNLNGISCMQSMGGEWTIHFYRKYFYSFLPGHPVITVRCHRVYLIFSTHNNNSNIISLLCRTFREGGCPILLHRYATIWVVHCKYNVVFPLRGSSRNQSDKTINNDLQKVFGVYTCFNGDKLNL